MSHSRPPSDRCDRIGLTYEAEAENVVTEQIIEQIINAVIVP